MSHAETYMTRTYFGEADKLFSALEELLAGKEVVIPCMVDGPREMLQRKTAKIQTVKANLKLIDYNPKRDVVAILGDVAAGANGKQIITLLDAGSGGWKVAAASTMQVPEQQWRSAKFDDKLWSAAKTPVGYGEPEIGSRKGTTIKEQGQAMLFRRTVDIPADLLARKDLRFELKVASADSAAISVNGKVVADEPQADHEFSYWNQIIPVPADAIQAGTNVIAVLVRNTAKSSDLYFDLELSAEFKKSEK